MAQPYYAGEEADILRLTADAVECANNILYRITKLVPKENAGVQALRDMADDFERGLYTRSNG